MARKVDRVCDTPIMVRGVEAERGHGLPTELKITKVTKPSRRPLPGGYWAHDGSNAVIRPSCAHWPPKSPSPRPTPGGYRAHEGSNAVIRPSSARWPPES